VCVCVSQKYGFGNGRVRDRKMWAVGKVGVNSRMEMARLGLENRNGGVRDRETWVVSKVGDNSKKH